MPKLRQQDRATFWATIAAAPIALGAITLTTAPGSRLVLPSRLSSVIISGRRHDLGEGRTLTIIPLQRLQDYVHTSPAPSQIQGLVDDFLAGALSEDA